ncbi:MAG: transporter ATP-binding protein [Herminiimonas sp.]|nr:transporter ATP-binding protein [Herminiimonas sp.]
MVRNFRFAAPLADHFYVVEHRRQIVEHFAATELQEKAPLPAQMLGS